MQRGSIFHVLSSSSNKAKGPVRSIGAAEILAAVEAIDEGKMLAKSPSMLFSTHVPLFIALDSKDLFTSLSTHRAPFVDSIYNDPSSIGGFKDSFFDRIEEVMSMDIQMR